MRSVARHMNMPARRLAAATGVCLAAAACGGAEPETACAALDGVVHAGRLPDTAHVATFRELWRVGGTDDASYFSVPLPLAVSREGRAAIADFELGELFVVERNGTWSGSIARRGMGPGELTSPVAAVWDDAGSLHVYDLVKPAILEFDAALNYVGEQRAQSEAAAAVFASGELAWAGVQPSGATLLIPGLRGREGAGSSANPVSFEMLVRVAPGGNAADTLGDIDLPTVAAGDFTGRALPGHPRLAASVGAGGGLAVVGGAGHWLVDVYSNDGTRAMRICADAPAQPLTPAERGRGADTVFADLARAFADAGPVNDPARHGRVVVGADQSIWVERERPEPYPGYMQHYGRAGSTFDILSPEGEHVWTLRLPPRARLQGALGDTIWAYEIGEMDDISLVAYEVVRQ